MRLEEGIALALRAEPAERLVPRPPQRVLEGYARLRRPRQPPRPRLPMQRVRALLLQDLAAASSQRLVTGGLRRLEDRRERCVDHEVCRHEINPAVEVAIE